MFFQAPDKNVNNINGKTYLQWAKEAVDYARSQCPLGAANNQLDMMRAKQDDQDKILIAKTAEWQAKTKFGSGAELTTRPLTWIDICNAADRAKEIRAANCVGLSCLAYQYLVNNHVVPVELVSFQDGNHMFILLGRSSEYAPLLSGETGLPIDDCVICDPWANKVYQSDGFDREKYLSSAQDAIAEIKRIRDEIKVEIIIARQMYALKYVVPMFDYLNGIPRICYRETSQSFRLGD